MAAAEAAANGDPENVSSAAASLDPTVMITGSPYYVHTTNKNLTERIVANNEGKPIIIPSGKPRQYLIVYFDKEHNQFTEMPIEVKKDKEGRPYFIEIDSKPIQKIYDVKFFMDFIARKYAGPVPGFVPAPATPAPAPAAAPAGGAGAASNVFMLGGKHRKRRTRRTKNRRSRRHK